MEAIVVLLMSLTVTAIALFAISRSHKPKDRVYRFTSFPKSDGTKSIILVTAQNQFEAYRSANEWKQVESVRWLTVEELDPTDHDKVIKVLADLTPIKETI